MYYYTKYGSPIGELTLLSDGNALIGLWIREQKYFGSDLMNAKYSIEKNDCDEILKKTKNWLDRYFKGEKPEACELKLNPNGGEFRQEVWKILCEIPYGETISYGEIAKRIADIRGIKSMSAQAVGQAIGHNPIGIIIPCHRVIGKNGNLTGYTGGIDIKKWLLTHEKAI